MYFGWTIVGMAGFIFMLLIGTTFGAFSLFVIPVSQEFGLSRADMNTAFILLQLGGALCAPFVGRALDRFPARRIMAVSGVLFGVSMTALGLSQSIWLSALVLFLLLPITETGAGALAFGVILVRWFSANRGKAMLFFNLGGPFSAILVIPIMAKLIGDAGWRNTLMISGVVVALCILATAFVIRERPAPGEGEQELPAVPDATSAVTPPPTADGGPARVSAILRMPQFWIIVLACCMPVGITGAVMVSIYPFALQQGFSPVEATGLMSTTGFSSIGGIMLASLVIDRIDRRLILIGLFLIDATALGLLSFSASYAVTLLAVMLLGISMGIILPAMLTYQADLFGPASFGTVRGMMAPILAIVGGILVRFAGEVYDRTGGYDLMFYTFVVAEIVSALMLSLSLFWRPALQPRAPQLKVNL